MSKNKDKNSKIIDLNNKIDLSSIKNIEDEINDENTVQNNISDEQNDNILEEMIKNQIEIVPVLSAEDSSKRRELILKINRYRQRFSNLCGEWIGMDITKKSIPELENIHNDIRLTVQNDGVNNLSLLGYLQCIETIEGLAPILNMDLQGLSMICMKDQTIRNCVDELCIEMTSSKIFPPHYRLLILTGGIAMQINNKNKSSKIINNFLDKSVSVELQEKYNDI